MHFCKLINTFKRESEEVKTYRVLPRCELTHVKSNTVCTGVTTSVLRPSNCVRKTFKKPF